MSNFLALQQLGLPKMSKFIIFGWGKLQVSSTWPSISIGQNVKKFRFWAILIINYLFVFYWRISKEIWVYYLLFKTLGSWYKDFFDDSCLSWDKTNTNFNLFIAGKLAYYLQTQCKIWVATKNEWHLRKNWIWMAYLQYLFTTVCYVREKFMLWRGLHCKYLQFLIVSSFHCNFVVRFTLIT